MRVLRGNREDRIEKLRKLVDMLFGMNEDGLREIIKNNGEDTFGGDLAIALIGDRREETVKLCNELLEAKDSDKDFLEQVVADDDIPEPIKAIANHVLKERGMKCKIEKIIEWR